MTNLSFVPAALVIVLLTLFAGTHAIHAQPNTDDILKGMPKEQKEVFLKFLDLSKQYKKALKTKNPVAKKEAMDKVGNDSRELLGTINSTLSKDGVKDWVGSAGIKSGYLSINYKSKQDGVLTVSISIPTKGMQKDVLDVVKKLAKGDQVRFTIATDEKNPAKMRS